ncbi:MAG: glycosyltransferase [Acidobacteriota bacterium]|nr:glycosyltransferase [Acidobacteriota bacterium]
MLGEFQHGIDQPPPGITSDAFWELRGWCLMPGVVAVPALRLRVRTFRGSRVIESFEPSERPGMIPLGCGFHFHIPLSFAANVIRLEARTETGWIALYRTAVWRIPRFLELPRRAPAQERVWPSELPLVTVVILCHNQGEKAREALESVLRQTFSRVEVIIVDDGSGDPATVQILDHLANAVVLRQIQHNPAEAYYMAVRAARGKWVCRLSPEERLAPTYIEKSLFVLETEGERAQRILRPELWSRAGAAQRAAGGRPARPGGYHNLLPSLPPADSRTPILLALPFLTIGGAEASLSRICAQLSQMGFRFVVVTTVPTGPEHGDSTAWFEKSTSEIFQLPQFLSESRWPDFIDYLIESRGIRVLWQVGSTYMYQQLPRLKGRFAELRVLDLLFNPVGHAASFLKYNCFIDHVVAEHSGMEQWLRGSGWSAEKITVIPNGIELEQFQPGVESRVAARKFTVGFFGRLSEEKGPDVFVEIATQLRDRGDIEFCIAGGGPLADKMRHNLQGLRNARFLGFVDAADFLPCCDVLVVCSRLDGRPNSVMEAQALGVPVIASRVGGLPEMISEGRTGLLVDADDIAGFVRAILKLSGDRALQDEMRQSARSWAETHFSLSASAGMYARLLRGLEARR